MSRLTKDITTEFIPGDPGEPATPGSPAKPAYCATEYIQSCQWVQNPAVTYQRVCWTNNSQQECAFVPYYNGQQITSGMGIQLYSWQCSTHPETVCYSAKAAVPGTPGRPPRAAQIITSLNLGWNTVSRTVSPLLAGERIEFYVAAGVRGVFVGVDVAGKELQPMSAFSHGMLIDLSGVHVFESGVVGTELDVTHIGTDLLYISRSPSGVITYGDSAATEAESAVSVNPSDELYTYWMLYAGGDMVLDAAYAAIPANEVFEAITFSAVGSTVFGTPNVDGTFDSFIRFDGTGSLGVVQAYPYPVTLSASGQVYGLSSSTIGQEWFPALGALGSEGEYSQGYASFPALVTEAASYTYIPPAPTYAYGNLPLLVGSGFAVTVEVDTGDADFPALAALGGDYEYGVAAEEFSPLVSYGNEPLYDGLWLMSSAILDSPMQQQPALVLVLMSDGTLESIYSSTLEYAQLYMSELLAQSEYSLLGTYLIDFSSELLARSLGNQILNGSVATSTETRVWVVNLDTSASSQYEGYSFNSFFRRGEYFYGVASDGVYRLDGDTDAGNNIVTYAQLPKIDFDTSRVKYVPKVYVGATSDRELVLRIDTAGQTRYYMARTYRSESMANHRFDVGQGAKGTHWQFAVVNNEGCNFDLASIAFTPIATGRRI